MTPEVLDIDPDLRLVQLDAPPVEALSWYQDPETLWMVDGKREPYTPERLAQLLTQAGFLDVTVRRDGPQADAGRIFLTAMRSLEYGI